MRILHSIADHARPVLAYVAETVGRTCASVARALREGFSPRQRRLTLLAFASLALAAVFCAFMAWLIASIAAKPEGFARLVDENAVLAAALYALVNAVQIFAVFIPGEPLELVAGYLFGVWGGLLVVSLGLAVGEALAFVLVKRYGTRAVHHFVSPQKLNELAFFKDARRLNTVTFLMMLIPGTPKDVVTFIVGLTPMRLGTWMAICIPARVVSILASTLVGAKVAQDDWVFAVTLFLATLVVSALGLYYYAAISRQAHEAAIIEELGRREWEAAGKPTNDAADL